MKFFKVFFGWIATLAVGLAAGYLVDEFLTSMQEKKKRR